MNIIAVSNSLHDSSTLFQKKDTFFIRKKEELLYEKLLEIQPQYIFFPHWSYIIPKQIYENFRCVIFHMTDLPFGRGGSPLQNLLARGIYTTKISAITCVKELDAGDVYLKKDFSIKDGSASEIYVRAGDIISTMIDEIITTNPTPVKQAGNVVCFSRRTPSMSNIKDIDDMKILYDYIRMLDCDGYPKAFLETSHFRYEFSNASLENGELNANIQIKGNHEEE